MKFLSLLALTLSMNVVAATDCDRVLDDLVELGVTKGVAETLIGEYQGRLKGFEAIQKALDQNPNLQTLGAYDRELLKKDVKDTKAAIRRLEGDLLGVSHVAPRIRALAKERCR